MCAEQGVCIQWLVTRIDSLIRCMFHSCKPTLGASAGCRCVQAVRLLPKQHTTPPSPQTTHPSKFTDEGVAHTAGAAGALACRHAFSITHLRSKHPALATASSFDHAPVCSKAPTNDSRNCHTVHLADKACWRATVQGFRAKCAAQDTSCLVTVLPAQHQAMQAFHFGKVMSSSSKSSCTAAQHHESMPDVVRC
jgi:hypothetical protein